MSLLLISALRLSPEVRVVRITLTGRRGPRSQADAGYAVSTGRCREPGVSVAFRLSFVGWGVASELLDPSDRACFRASATVVIRLGRASSGHPAQRDQAGAGTVGNAVGRPTVFAPCISVAPVPRPGPSSSSSSSTGAARSAIRDRWTPAPISPPIGANCKSAAPMKTKGTCRSSRAKMMKRPMRTKLPKASPTASPTTICFKNPRAIERS